MKICFLTSGRGGNFKFMHLSQTLSLIHDFELSLIADRECFAIKYAREKNIHCKLINYKKEYNIELLNELNLIDPDIIITNWYKIIDTEIVQKYKGKLINLHYSLLPAFSGLIGVEPIKQAYKKNCQYVGATCHYVDEGVDSGKIIAQAIVKTDVKIESAIEDVFKKGCLILLNSILIINNKNLIEKEKNNQLEYSPSLKFDNTIFNKEFWNKVSKL